MRWVFQFFEGIDVLYVRSPAGMVSSRHVLHLRRYMSKYSVCSVPLTKNSINLLRNSDVGSDKTLSRLSFLFVLRPYQPSLPSSR